MSAAAVGTSHFVLGGDCLERLPDLESGVANCCVTSPPYWGLRDYDVPPTVWPEIVYRTLGGSVTVPAMECCLGMESTPDAFVGHLVHVFREVRRVLRDDGVLWLNLGDSYAAGKSGRSDQDRNSRNTDGRNTKNATDTGAPMYGQRKLPDGFKPKDLVGIPWRVAFALQADGWYLRQDIIWAKPNPMPESVRDRCTKAHEMVFLLTKSERYYFDSDAIKEDSVDPEKSAARYKHAFWENGKHQAGGYSADGSKHTPGIKEFNGKRNKRSVWTITTKPYKGAHFATMPPELAETCILSGCPVGGMVLDPFGGSGTTAGVAKRLGRNSVICELNQRYVKDLIPDRMKRLAGDGPSLF